MTTATLCASVCLAAGCVCKKGHHRGRRSVPEAVECYVGQPSRPCPMMKLQLIAKTDRLLQQGGLTDGGKGILPAADCAEAAMTAPCGVIVLSRRAEDCRKRFFSARWQRRKPQPSGARAADSLRTVSATAQSQRCRCAEAGAAARQCQASPLPNQPPNSLPLEQNEPKCAVIASCLTVATPPVFGFAAVKGDGLHKCRGRTSTAS